MEYVLLIPVLLLLFFFPGFTLVQALFPSAGEMDPDDDLIFRIFASVTLSVILSGSIITLLALRPGESMTSFNMAGLLSLFSLFFFYVGYQRGAYPFLGGTEAPMVVASALPKDELVLQSELEGKLKVTDRDLAVARKRAEGSTNIKLKQRVKLLEVEHELLAREIEIMDKPPELRALHEQAQVLIRRWGRLNRAEANARPSPRRDRLVQKKAEVERQINELHGRIGSVERGAVWPPQ